jgi:uncharacterized membrane protein YkvA (DUF1232 family)
MKSIMSLWKIISFLKDKNVSFSKKALFFIPVLYFLLPFDLVGDFFPLAGQLDDIAVLIIMWPMLKRLLANYSAGDSMNYKKDDKNAVDIEKEDYRVE